MRISSLIVIVVIALACAHSLPQESGAPPISTGDSAVVPDSLAQRLLIDLHELDSNLIIDARDSTPNNFTGAPIPGYGSNSAMLRRKAAAALVRVERRLSPAGLTLADRTAGGSLEIGTPFDTFSAEAHTANATGIAAANHARLKAAMSSEELRTTIRDGGTSPFRSPTICASTFRSPDCCARAEGDHTM